LKSSAPQPWHPRTDVFFAIYPPDDIGPRIEDYAKQLANQHGLHGKPLGRRRFHATLCPIGVHSYLPRSVLDAVVRAAATITVPPFDVVFDQAESFPRRQGKQPLVLLGGNGVARLVAFQRALEAALRRFGISEAAGRPYNPHVTLLYDERGVSKQKIEPIRWSVREFVLVRSLIGQGKHIALKRWQLRD
jgi:RNA 2',3'-cyclic 3'-phosphodiesterase